MVALPAEIAGRLDVEEGTTAALRRCIRYLNDQPNSIQDSYHPKWLTDAVPELTSPHDIAIGTNRLLADRGYELAALGGRVERVRRPDVDRLRRRRPGRHDHLVRTRRPEPVVVGIRPVHGLAPGGRRFRRPVRLRHDSSV